MSREFQVKNWYLSFRWGNMVVKGCVFDNPQFEQGRRIYTSNIEDMKLEKQDLLVYTLNSMYRCPLAQVNPSHEPTKEYFIERYPEEKSRWEVLFNGDPKRPPTPMADLEFPFPSGAYVLCLDSVRSYLFSGLFQKVEKEYHWAVREAIAHEDAKQECVLCTVNNHLGLPLFDVRYHPLSNNSGVEVAVKRLACYMGALPTSFYIVNVGAETVTVDGVLLEPEDYIQVLDPEAKPPAVAYGEQFPTHKNIPEKNIPVPSVAFSEEKENVIGNEPYQNQRESSENTESQKKKSGTELSDRTGILPREEIEILSKLMEQSGDSHSKGNKGKESTEETVKKSKDTEQKPCILQKVDITEETLLPQEELGILEVELQESESVIENEPDGFDLIPPLNLESMPELNSDAVIELKLSDIPKEEKLDKEEEEQKEEDTVSLVDMPEINLWQSKEESEEEKKEP